jgi:hypothetical protein
MRQVTVKLSVLIGDVAAQDGEHLAGQRQRRRLVVGARTVAAVSPPDRARSLGTPS